jgi:hypothetical protein
MQNKKYIHNFNKFKYNKKLNEELNIGDVFTNLFKSKKTKQYESSIKEWTALNQKFNDIFSKNKKWKEYLTKFGYMEGVSDNLLRFWKRFIDSDIILYPFKVNGKNYQELNENEITLLKSMIEQSINMRLEFKQVVDNIQKSSSLLFDNWKLISKEFGNKLDKIEEIGSSKDINNKILNKIDNVKLILKSLVEGYIPNLRDEDSLKSINIFLKDLSYKDFTLQENKNINFVKLYLNITENFDKKRVIDNIKKEFESIEVLKKIKQRIDDLKLIQLINNSKLNSEITILDKKYSILNICKELNISPSKFGDDKEMFEKINKVCTSIHYSDLDYSKQINELFDLCDKVLNKNDFFDRLTITTSEIISDNKLTSSDIYFTHSSSIKNLSLDTIKFDYDEAIRGARSENTPKDIYGLYITNWKSDEKQEYDAWHYIYRSIQATGMLSPENVYLYTIDLKEDARFLISNKSAFRQTNQSTKEFADYCISLGLSGYYDPNAYGDKSALEIVIIDKKVIKDFKRNDKEKDKILSVEYYSKKEK